MPPLWSGHTWKDCYTRIEKNWTPAEKERSKKARQEIYAKKDAREDADKKKEDKKSLYCVYCQVKGHWRTNCTAWEKLTKAEKDAFNEKREKEAAAKKAEGTPKKK